MTSCVERVVGVRLPTSRVSYRLSAGGKYVSVTIGPVLVETPDQVRAVAPLNGAGPSTRDRARPGARSEGTARALLCMATKNLCSHCLQVLEIFNGMKADGRLKFYI